MISDIEAYAILVAAWDTVRVPPPTEAHLHVAMCVARHETRYGRSWQGAMIGSHNWGAIQAGRPPAKTGYSRLYQDSHPNKNGSNTSYAICFREYPTDEDGARDLLRVLFAKRPFVLRAAETGNLKSVAKEMHATGYFEGFGATIEDRIRGYQNALWRVYQTILLNTKWEPVLTLDGSIVI